MFTRNVFILGAALFLSGCTSYEGPYAPACLMHSGSEIRLSDGRYVWTKFTDQVVVDDDGHVVDPCPGFPLEGTYKFSGQTVTLVPDSRQTPETLYVHVEQAAVFLLTAEEKAAMEAGGARPEFALHGQSPGT